MTHQSPLEEFVDRARTLCTTPSRSLRKEAENFFQASRSHNTDLTFQVCVDILVHMVATLERTDLTPEVLLASQTLCWICKHKPVPVPQMQAVSEILTLLAVQGYQAKHPLVVQITSAVSAALITNYMRVGSTDVNWSGKVVESMFTFAAQRSISTELWVTYILSVLSTMPEVVASKDVVLLVCASSDTAHCVAADASVLKNLLVAGELLREASSVERTAVQAAAFAPSGGILGHSTDLLADIMRCCALWINFAAQTLHTRLPAAISSQAVQPICEAALESVSVWQRSSLLNTAFIYLQSGHSGAGMEACLEMCVALCNAVDLDENSSPQIASHIEAHLCTVAQAIALQLLPALSSLLSMASTEYREVFQSHKLQKTDDAHVESVLEKCLLFTRSAAECATALLPRAFKPLFSHPNNPIEPSVELSAVANSWVTFINAFQNAVQYVEQDHNNVEVVEFVGTHRQQLLEIGLSFVSDLAEATYATSAELFNENVLVSTVNVAVENVLVAAVRASSYKSSVQNRLGTSGDDFDEFRNYVRDCLRLLVSSVPSLALWLVNHTVQSIGALSQQVLTIAGANQSGHIGTIDWPMTEALLHALTAITKHIHSQVRTPSGEDLFNATFQLATLLSSDDICCACRPISRMCVVLYSELTPIFLDVLPRLAASGANSVANEAQMLAVVQVLRAMILRLILSLYHPEAPFHQQRQLPASIAMVQSVSSKTRLFVLALDRPGINLDCLCVEGCYIPFRVKQDHIGAVSLQKTVAAVLAHILLHPMHSQALVSALCGPPSNSDVRNEGLLHQLPRITQLVQESQRLMTQQQQTLSESVLHLRRGAFDSEGNIAQTLLFLTLFHLTSLQQLQRENQSMTYKSFQLQLHALYAGLLLSSSPSAPLSTQAVVQNVGALSAPVGAAIAHILALRAGGAESTHVRAFVSHCCHVLSERDSEVCVNAVMELSQLLYKQCSFPQLFSILSALIHEIRLTCAKASSSLAGVYYGALLCIVETCVPLLEMLVHAARDKSLALTDLETEALRDFLSACSCIEYCAAAMANDPTLSTTGTAMLLRLQENYLSLLREGTKGVKRQLLLPVALATIKSVCTWSAVANVAELFNRMVCEVSTIGIQVAAEEQQQRALKDNNKLSSGSRDRVDENGAFFFLLQFWSVCISRTVLLPAAPPAATAAASRGKSVKNQQSEVVAKLSFDALGWNTLDCIVAQVCQSFEYFCLNPSTEHFTNCSCHGHVDNWEAALKVLTLSLGPVNSVTSTNASILDPDGRVTPAAVKDTTCHEEPAGEPELVRWLVQSGHAERICRALLFALLQSTSSPAAITHDSPSTSRKESCARSFPSELREDCLSCLIKLVLCLGTARAGVSLNQALQHAQCPRNGVLGAQSVSASVKVAQWVEKLFAQGKAGDWKKFRSHAKTLCRG